jgi:hypothetical protein
VRDALRPLGIAQVALAGYANEYLHYFTTPEEYDQQHYEGGSTVFGKFSSNLVKDDLVTLAGRLVRGEPAPDPVDFDPRNGVIPDLRPYDGGADHGEPGAQPGAVTRMQRAEFAWRGAAQGLDRPLDRPFVTVERQVKRRWRTITDDLGLQILWRVDDQGRYLAQWQVPLTAAAGTYRFVVTANRYKLTSGTFRVSRSTALKVRVLDRTGNVVRAQLDYPPLDMLADLLSRPARASGGRITARVGRRTRVVRARPGQPFAIRTRPGTQIRIAAGAARDRFGNRNAESVTVAP